MRRISGSVNPGAAIVCHLFAGGVPIPRSRPGVSTLQSLRPCIWGALVMADERVDVLVVGAGISGIGAAYHLQKLCPQHSFAIVEARQGLGGTWDLFRYPGVRSDSDMHTLGYSFRPWVDPKAIVEGPTILRYLQDTAREHGIDRKIRFGHKVVRADWSS